MIRMSYLRELSSHCPAYAVTFKARLSQLVNKYPQFCFKTILENTLRLQLCCLFKQAQVMLQQPSLLSGDRSQFMFRNQARLGKLISFDYYFEAVKKDAANKKINIIKQHGMQMMYTFSRS